VVARRGIISACCPSRTPTQAGSLCYISSPACRAISRNASWREFRAPTATARRCKSSIGFQPVSGVGVENQANRNDPFAARNIPNRPYLRAIRVSHQIRQRIPILRRLEGSVCPLLRRFGLPAHTRCAFHAPLLRCPRLQGSVKIQFLARSYCETTSLPWTSTCAASYSV
jgi:hypothetical protein